MPSFDVVSEVDLHQLTNAVDQASRIVANRFDFKGIDAGFERDGHTVALHAEVEFQLAQMEDMLRSALIKCDIDPQAMEVGDAVASGKVVRQTVTLRNGLDSQQCKSIVKQLKEAKLKVQATGKKRDDLQQAIALLRECDVDLPLQFTNFRD